MPRFWDLFFAQCDERKSWIGAGFVGFDWLLPMRKMPVGGLTSVFAGKFEGPH